MTENEMAAIAAGLWHRDRPCDIEACNCGGMHKGPPPDMHLPENLWRALDKMGDSLKLSRDWDTAGWRVVLYRDHGHANIARDASTAVAAVFAALIALYKAEHPE